MKGRMQRVSIAVLELLDFARMVCRMIKSTVQMRVEFCGNSALQFLGPAVDHYL